MFAIVAAVIFFLRAFGVIDSTADVDWVLVAAGFWALHFGWNPFPVIMTQYNSRRSP